jgi:divalent metal cation (Fe/Co/Zn/Cd) transporter
MLMAEKKPSMLLGVLSLLGGAAIGYWWTQTFAGLWVGGLVGFLLAGLVWAFVPVLMNPDRAKWKR